MQFTQVTNWNIPEGEVIRVTDSLNRVIWEKQQPTPTNEYFYVEDVSGADNTLTIVHSSGAPNFTVYTSTNQSNWTSIGNTSTGNLTATIPANSKLYLRATTSAWGSGTQFKDNRIRVANNYNVGGNIMTLLKASPSYTSLSSSDDWTFLELFVNETKLLNANLLYLPTDTKRHCYHSMFGGCTNLRTAPALPATTMTEDCYDNMFSGCRSLTQAPALPATTLADSCYVNMFNSCTSLTTAPALPATALANNCYGAMFSGCTGITVAPVLPATTLVEWCYSYMFKGCTSLTQAPALPATTLTERCYYYMFWGCTSLTQAPALPATTLAPICYCGMFNSCTSLTQAPVLPATTLTERCYYFMFDTCTNLNSVTTYAQDISATDCLTNWLQNVPSTGDFYNYGNATYPSGASGIPSGWTEHTNPGI